MSDGVGQVSASSAAGESAVSVAAPAAPKDRIAGPGGPDEQAQMIMDLRRKATEMGGLPQGPSNGNANVTRPPAWEVGGSSALRRLLVESEAPDGRQLSRVLDAAANNGNAFAAAQQQRDFFMELTRRSALTFNSDVMAAPLEWPGFGGKGKAAS